MTTTPTRLVPTLLGLVLACSAPAASSVWKVSKDGSEAYLGGTIHLLRPEDFPLPPEFDLAYEASTDLVFETDMMALTDMAVMQDLARRALLPPDQKLADFLSEETWAELTAYCEEIGMPAFVINRMKPSMAMLTLLSFSLGKLGVGDTGVDLHYNQRGVEDGRRIITLETIDEQLDFILNMGEGDEEEFVRNSLRDLQETPELLIQAIGIWREGRADEIDAVLMAPMREDYPEIYQRLLVDRNNAWLEKLLPLLESPGTEYVLVGAGHLVGPDGLLRELAKRGYTVEQVEVPEPAAE